MYRYAISFDNPSVLDPNWREAVRNAKIRRIELSFASQAPADQEAEGVKFLSRMQKDGDVEVASIHIPFAPFSVWSLADPEESKRRNGVRKILDFLKIYRPLGTRNYTLHGSGEPNLEENRPAVFQSLRKSLAELKPVFEDLEASVNIEILPRTCIGRNAEELRDVLEDFPERTFGVCFDVNHLCGCPEKVPAGIRLLSGRIRSFHISDYDGIDECHWYPGLGVLDWREIMSAVREIRQDVLLIFEVTHIAPPAFQKRGTFPPCLFSAAERSAFLLDHAAELQERFRTYRPN